MKRAGILLLIILALTAADVLAAEDFLHGEVLTIDREASRMTIRTGAEGAEGVVQSVALTEKLLIDNRSGGKRLPGCIELGRHVRVWGEAAGEGEVFLAEEVRGCGMGGCTDPTGVRQRLNRGRKNGMAAPCCR